MILVDSIHPTPHVMRLRSTALGPFWLHVVTVVLLVGMSGCDGGGSSAEPTPPPSGVEATSEDGAVALSWEAGGASVEGYNVYRSTSSTSSPSGSPVNGASPVQGTTFTDSSVENGTRYYYRITAVGEGGESEPSVEVSVRPFPSPPGRP